MRVSSFLRGGMAAVAALAAIAATAAEYPIGKQQIQGGMEIGAVYLQPITMEPEGMMRKASDSDVHLEADIHAVKNNPTGFAEGDWMPYLQVSYELTKAGSNQTQKGDMMAMVANDGPHYGDNVKLQGPGKYHLKLTSSNRRCKPAIWPSAVTSTRKPAWVRGSSRSRSNTTSRSRASARRAGTDQRAAFAWR
jgi:uncharacterized protein involved in high-affinity Fe2+ transport